MFFEISKYSKIKYSIFLLLLLSFSIIIVLEVQYGLSEQINKPYLTVQILVCSSRQKKSINRGTKKNTADPSILLYASVVFAVSEATIILFS
jgi:hypothetical protein